MSIRLVMLGDIVGRPGRQAVAQLLPTIRDRWQPDLVIANAENAANGSGLSTSLYKKICASGVDGITLGDHVYKRLDIVNTLETQANIIRPANLPAAAKGKRWMRLDVPRVDRAVYVMTVLGRLFMSNMPADDPFATVDEIMDELPEPDPIVIVEVHAEATSEKQALGWYLNGRVTLVAGTHTHVATADARILSTTDGLPGAEGTAYITDLGMCGPHRSVLGRRIEPVLTKMTTAMPAPFDVAEADPRVCGVFVEIDEASGRAVAVERIELNADTTAPPFSIR